MIYRALIATMILVWAGGCLPSCGPEQKEKDVATKEDAAKSQPDSTSRGEDAAEDVGIADDFEVARSSLQRSTPGVADEKVNQLTRDNADFAFELYDEIAEPGQNLFYSPYSISIALAMTYAGAEGETETQMADAMHYELAEDELHRAFNALDLALESRGEDVPGDEEGDPFQLEIANSTWGQKDLDFEQPYLDTLAANYGAGMRLLDFTSDPEQARLIINAWIAMKTRDRIKDLIPAGVITTLTRLVLTNAIYFKAGWKEKFDEASTQKGDFKRLDGTTVQADLMHMKADDGLSYASGEGWTAAELPYVGEDVSMVVLLPDDGQFEAVEGQLDGQMVMDVFDALRPQAVDITFPRFEFESKFSLGDALKALGMTNAFTADANFSGITKATELFIQAVLHKAFVSVDEEGTEAAAATAVVVGTTSVPDYVEFEANRPFLFLIRDRETNAVLFAGRVVDPTQ